MRVFSVCQRRPPEPGGDPGSDRCGSAAPRPPACVLGGPVPGRIPRRPRTLGRLQRCHTPGRYSNHRLYTANEGPVRIQYKCLVPIYVFPEMKLCSLVISKTELECSVSQALGSKFFLDRERASPFECGFTIAKKSKPKQKINTVKLIL